LNELVFRNYGFQNKLTFYYKLYKISIRKGQCKIQMLEKTFTLYLIRIYRQYGQPEKHFLKTVEDYMHTIV